MKAKQNKTEKHLWNSQSRDTNSIKDWVLDVRLYDTSLHYTIPPEHVNSTSLNTHLQHFLLSSIPCPTFNNKKNYRSCWKVKKKITTTTKNTQFVETEQATRTRFKHGRVVEIISLGIYGNDDEYVKDTNVEGCFLIIWKFTNWIGNLGCSWSVTSLSHVHGNLIVLYIDHCEFLTELGPKNPNHCAEKERS